MQGYVDIPYLSGNWSIKATLARERSPDQTALCPNNDGIGFSAFGVRELLFLHLYVNTEANKKACT